MKNTVLAKLLPFGLALAGCATPDLQPDEATSAIASKGIALGSVSYKGRSSGYAIHYRDQKGREGRVQIGEGSVMMPLSSSKPDIVTSEGAARVFALSLEPGEYEIYKWSVHSGGIRLNSVSPFALRFTVRKGEAVYVGSFQFRQTHSLGLAVAGASLDLRSELERDIQLFKRRYPALVETPLTFSIESTADVVDLGGSSRIRVNLPFFVPVPPR
jgi:hypothetical protein